MRVFKIDERNLYLYFDDNWGIQPKIQLGHIAKALKPAKGFRLKEEHNPRLYPF